MISDARLSASCTAGVCGCTLARDNSSRSTGKLLEARVKIELGRAPARIRSAFIPRRYSSCFAANDRARSNDSIPWLVAPMLWLTSSTTMRTRLACSSTAESPACPRNGRATASATNSTARLRSVSTRASRRRCLVRRFEQVPDRHPELAERPGRHDADVGIERVAGHRLRAGRLRRHAVHELQRRQRHAYRPGASQKMDGYRQSRRHGANQDGPGIQEHQPDLSTRKPPNVCKYEIAVETRR